MTKQQADPPVPPMTVQDVLLLVLQADAYPILGNVMQTTEIYEAIQGESGIYFSILPVPLNHVAKKRCNPHPHRVMLHARCGWNGKRGHAEYYGATQGPSRGSPYPQPRAARRAAYGPVWQRWLSQPTSGSTQHQSPAWVERVVFGSFVAYNNARLTHL